jgi:hypothetical protein
MSIETLLKSYTVSLESVQELYNKLTVDNYIINLNEPELLSIVVVPKINSADGKKEAYMYDLSSLYHSFPPEYWNKQICLYNEYLENMDERLLLWGKQHTPYLKAPRPIKSYVFKLTSVP